MNSSDTHKPATLSQADYSILLATLYDGMKRLEMALLSNNSTDKLGYIEQAMERRKKVEDKLFERVINKPLIT